MLCANVIRMTSLFAPRRILKKISFFLSAAYIYQIFHGDKRFAPFVFFDLKTSIETKQGTNSSANTMEATFLVSLLARLTEALPSFLAVHQKAFKSFYTSKKYSVGIITPYKQQLIELKKCLEASSGKIKGQIDAVEVNTVV